MKAATFKNLTPHDLVVYDADKQNAILTVPSERGEDGKPIFIRVEQHYDNIGTINSIPVVQTTLGAVTGLPSKQDNVYLIVSLMVAQACPDRTDLLVPDTNAGAVRNGQGQIIGTTRLMRV